jgi:SAM-dependent methyltransferase
MQQLYTNLGKYYDAIIADAVNTEMEVQFVASVLQEDGAKSVIDIGCGDGRHSIGLAQYGFRVLGIDNSPQLLEIARSRSADIPHVTFSIQDAAAMKVTDTFDAAICMWSTFGELPYNKLVSQLKTTLRPDGLLLIDSRYFADKNTQKSTSYHREIKLKDGKTITIGVMESFENNKRIREITYQLDGQSLTDVNVMDVLTEQDFNIIMGQNGFIPRATYYDYSKTQPEYPERLQLVYVNKK